MKYRTLILTLIALLAIFSFAKSEEAAAQATNTDSTVDENAPTEAELMADKDIDKLISDINSELEGSIS